MESKERGIVNLSIRYIVLIITAIPNLWLFYLIFTPLTVYPVYFLLNIFFKVSLSGVTLTINNCPAIELIRACIAGSAYYLLLILNLTTPMNLKTRIYSIILTFSSFLVINILRIFLFSILLINDFNLFNTIHLIFWYVLSTLIVVGIWIINIKIFKIKKIPAYDDVRFLHSLIKSR